LTYNYTGQPLICPVGDPGCEFEGEIFVGSFTIDEDAMPGGAVSDLSLELIHDEDTMMNSYSITRGFEVTYAQWTDPDNTWESSGFLSGFTGIVSEFTSGVACCSSMSLIFDAAGNIVDWSGSAVQGGSNDPSFANSSDGRSNGAVSSGPGSWSVAAVPLPMSVWLLSMGLGALGFAARRKG